MRCGPIHPWNRRFNLELYAIPLGQEKADCDTDHGDYGAAHNLKTVAPSSKMGSLHVYCIFVFRFS